MPDYTVYLSKKAQKQLDSLSDKIVRSIIPSIAALENSPRPDGCKN